MLEIIKDTSAARETNDPNIDDMFGTLQYGDVVIVLTAPNLSPIQLRQCLTKFGLAYV